MSEWISVEDRLPENRKNGMFIQVLTINGLGAMNVFSWDDKHGLWKRPPRHAAITHWMPLPEPPTK